nr:putative reverse transcriptase domain-containing protein [Tanacetum cinerariifolium]
NPRYVGPFKVLERIRDVAYKLDLPEELSIVHNTFHVSNLKKCHADETLAVSLDGLHFDDKLHFVEEPVEIVDREVKWLKRSRIPLVKVRWISKRGPEECSSCEGGCSKGFVDNFVCDPNKSPDSSQRPLHNCPKCGNPVDGLYCRQCALLRKKLKEVWFTICDENEIFQYFLNTSESSNDNTNVINAPQEPFVFNQDPGKNSSQSPPHIDHHCCYGCGDSLDSIFCQRCTCVSYRNSAHIGYNYPPQVPIISNIEQCYNQNVDEFPQTLLSFQSTCYSGDENSFTYDSNLNFVDDSPNPPTQPPTYSYEFCGNDANYVMIVHLKFCLSVIQNRVTIKTLVYHNIFKVFKNNIFVAPAVGACMRPFNNRHAFYNNDEDDDEEYTIAIITVLSTEEPIDSLIMEDEHLDTISAMKSDEVIKSCVEDLVPIPSDSEGISDDTCDVPFCDNSPPLDVLNDHFEIFSDFNDDCTSSDDDSIKDIDYVEALSPDSEPVSLEEVKDEILHVKLLNVNFLIANIESLNDNPTPGRVLKYSSPFPIPVEDIDFFFEKYDTSLSYSDNSFQQFETLSDHTEETSSGSTTTHADNSLPEYDLFLFEIEPDQSELTSVVMEDNLGEPRVHVPNVLPTHPTLMLDLDFIPLDDSLGSDLEVSFSSGIRNKIFDPWIFFEV